MKLLYLSAHSILEYDELTLFHELGYSIFSPGAYVEPLNPGDASLRPGIPGLEYDPNIVEQWHRLSSAHPGEDGKDHLTKEFVDNFDVIVVMHLPRWIERNWDAMKHKTVIWRTIGQSISNNENQLRPFRAEGMKIVRYSPMESNIPGFIGSDALIRFYKDPNNYGEWNGKEKRVISFAQSMKQRGSACNFEFFEETTRPFNRHLFGPGNEDIGNWTTGKVPYERLRQEMRNNRVYFYTGTHPASYTLNFIEAWMTGIPVIAIGSEYGNGAAFPNHDLYEIPHLIQDGVTGFVSDSKEELQFYIKTLFENDSLAAAIGKAGRDEAMRHFNKDMIKASWNAFLSK